jgi:hypothetical protein
MLPLPYGPAATSSEASGTARLPPVTGINYYQQTSYTDDADTEDAHARE